MRLPLFFLALLSRFFLALTQAHADHVLEFLPSYYPHEIRIEAIDTGSAATRLSSNSIHAYLGGDPFMVRPVPATLGHVDSLRSYRPLGTATPAALPVLRCSDGFLRKLAATFSTPIR